MLLTLFTLAACVQAPVRERDPYVDAFGAAMTALDAGELDVARERLLATRELDPDNANCAYHLACVAARRGETERAVAEFERAVAAGFDDVELAEWDADLAPLRAEAAFRALRERIRSRRSAPAARPLEVVRSPVIQGSARPSVSADGRGLLVPWSDGTLEAVDLERARTVRRWAGAPLGLELVRQRSDETLLALASDGSGVSRIELCILGAGGGAPIAHWTAGPAWPFRASEVFRPDGKRAFLPPWPRRGELWDCESAELLAILDPGVESISMRAWSADSRWLAIGTLKGAVQILDATTLQPVSARWQLSAPGRSDRARSVSALAFDACGERLAVGFWYPGERVDPKTGRAIDEDVPQDDIAIVEAPSGRVVAWLDQQAFNLRSSVTGVAFTPDGQHLVSADTGDVCYFDLQTRRQLWTWWNEEGGDEMSCAIECCSNSPYIATWGNGCREGVFDTRNGAKVTYDEGRSSRTWCVSEPLRLFARSDVDVLDLFGADELDLRAQRVRISAEDEFVHTPSGWWDGTVGGLRSVKVFTVDGRPVDVEREARRRWDPKRVRASIAGVKVRPPRML